MLVRWCLAVVAGAVWGGVGSDRLPAARLRLRVPQLTRRVRPPDRQNVTLDRRYNTQRTVHCKMKLLNSLCSEKVTGTRMNQVGCAG